MLGLCESIDYPSSHIVTQVQIYGGVGDTLLSGSICYGNGFTAGFIASFAHDVEKYTLLKSNKNWSVWQLQHDSCGQS